MDVIETKASLRDALQSIDPTSIVGLAPTMGNLHAGHLKLIKAARAESTVVVATIFVNPLQFGPTEDFESYPRVLEPDARLLQEHQTDLLFAPSMDEMYPSGMTRHTNVSLTHLTGVLCGSNRPGHFDGVATVVSKLFNLIQPQRAYFGEKDWQQLTLIRAMVRDLDFPIRIVGVPTVRSEDGLALSSRNGYLNADERAKAPLLYESLSRIRQSVLGGNSDYSKLESEAIDLLASKGFAPEYVSVREGASLHAASPASTDRRVFGAARLGSARLIDNIPIDE